MARKRPQSLAALARVNGVGQAKLTRYGTQFLDAIKAQPLPDLLNNRLGDTINETLWLYRSGLDAEAIARRRELKPANIYACRKGLRHDIAKVLDFGVARLIDDPDEERLTRTQGTPLTLLYASPEQVRAQPVDVASDVYQLGLLLYEMLTGRPAHDLADKSGLLGRRDAIPQATTGKPKLKDIAVELVRRPIRVELPKRSYRAELGLEDEAVA